jgi:hypothetical protein
MQASKIKVKGLYAINTDEGLHRFYVTRVDISRIDNTGSPHDYTSLVHGIDRDEITSDAPGVVIRLHPDKVLGPFEEYKELAEKAEREKAERLAKDKANKTEQLRQVAVIYDKLGVFKTPEKLDGYDSSSRPFHADYHGGMDVSREGLAALAYFLENAIDGRK